MQIAAVAVAGVVFAVALGPLAFVDVSVAVFVLALESRVVVALAPFAGCSLSYQSALVQGF